MAGAGTNSRGRDGDGDGDADVERDGGESQRKRRRIGSVAALSTAVSEDGDRSALDVLADTTSQMSPARGPAGGLDAHGGAGSRFFGSGYERGGAGTPPSSSRRPRPRSNSMPQSYHAAVAGVRSPLRPGGGLDGGLGAGIGVGMGMGEGAGAVNSEAGAGAGMDGGWTAPGSHEHHDMSGDGNGNGDGGQLVGGGGDDGGSVAQAGEGNTLKGKEDDASAIPTVTRSGRRSRPSSKYV